VIRGIADGRTGRAPPKPKPATLSRRCELWSRACARVKPEVGGTGRRQMPPTLPRLGQRLRERLPAAARIGRHERRVVDPQKTAGLHWLRPARLHHRSNVVQTDSRASRNRSLARLVCSPGSRLSGQDPQVDGVVPELRTARPAAQDRRRANRVGRGAIGAVTDGSRVRPGQVPASGTPPIDGAGCAIKFS
jgi:hypothetical protein